MANWISQFTSSYASAIAYGITILILSFLFKPIYILFSKWIIKQFSEKPSTRQKNNLILPTDRESHRFSTKQKTTENEWKDAIAFLKNDIPLLFKDSPKKVSLGFKIISHFEKYMSAYQLTFGGLGLIYLVATIFQARFCQSICLLIGGMLLLWIAMAFLISFLFLIIERKQEKSKIKKIKAQIHDAMNVITPGISFTYGQLGEYLKMLGEPDLTMVQAELSDIGLPFNIGDMKLARFLTTASPDQLIPFGERIASRITQLDNLTLEEKYKFEQMLVETLRLWPVTLIEPNKLNNN